MQAANGLQDVLAQFIAGNLLYIFVVVGLLVFFFRLDKSEKKKMLLATLILILVIFNPWSYQILSDKLGFVSRYYRFFWICPYNIVLAYVIYEAIRNIKSIQQRLIIVVITCILVLGYSIEQEELYLPDNIYQVSNDVIEVATVLEELMEQNGQKQITIIADDAITHSIREYDANICFPFQIWDKGSVPENMKYGMPYAIMAMIEEDRADVETERINQAIVDYEIDYLVIPSENKVTITYIQQLDWVPVGGTTNYVIMQYVA